MSLLLNRFFGFTRNSVTQTCPELGDGLLQASRNADRSVIATQAAGHIADLLKSDDAQAHKEARKFLALHFPQLIEKHNL